MWEGYYRELLNKCNNKDITIEAIQSVNNELLELVEALTDKLNRLSRRLLNLQVEYDSLKRSLKR